MPTPGEISQRKPLRSTAAMWWVGGSGWRRWRANPAKCRSLIVRLFSPLVYEHYTTRYIICVCKCGCACLNCLVLINVTSFKHEYIYILGFTCIDKYTCVRVFCSYHVLYRVNHRVFAHNPILP